MYEMITPELTVVILICAFVLGAVLMVSACQEIVKIREELRDKNSENLISCIFFTLVFFVIGLFLLSCPVLVLIKVINANFMYFVIYVFYILILPFQAMVGYLKPTTT